MVAAMAMKELGRDVCPMPLPARASCDHISQSTIIHAWLLLNFSSLYYWDLYYWDVSVRTDLIYILGGHFSYAQSYSENSHSMNRLINWCAQSISIAWIFNKNNCIYACIKWSLKPAIFTVEESNIVGPLWSSTMGIGAIEKIKNIIWDYVFEGMHACMHALRVSSSIFVT